ncbi:putative selenium-dependent hydroxylase accessory protein YqeC [Litorilinea aerophila]|uniref:Putative selenium-dependent hydroxylase accessory protein YqeC n=1 Tax=Litorilinea aerophila TaxID=1204385 RepID=A0A540VJN8_9CHLR|nr:selenium cofactor biosynthesis protein YqeC [Litorilinea aerophila]MCC9075465.1 putative selenium-dependent hydroxylase accessory protein YqeC [Litorilinea aerophila]
MELWRALRLDLAPETPHVVSFVGGGGKSTALFRLARELVAQGSRVIVTTTTHLGVAQTQGYAGLLCLAEGEGPPADGIADRLVAHGQCLLVGPRVGAKWRGLTAGQFQALWTVARALAVTAILVEADGSRGLPVKAPASHEPVVPPMTTLLVPVAGLDGVGAPVDGDHVHRPEQVRKLLGLDAGMSARLTPAQLARLLVHPAGGARHRPPTARLLPLLNKADDICRLVLGRLTAACLLRLGQASLVAAVAQEEEPVLERWAPWAAIVLAAGEGRRMGRPKQLVPVDGEPMVARAVGTVLAAGPSAVLVVTGAHGEQVQAALASWQAVAGTSLRLVPNPRWAEGQASSMRAGLLALDEAIQAALFLPVDQPLLSSRLLRQMYRCWQAGAPLVTPRVDGQIRGAPALFDRALWPELLAVQGDVGGREVLRRHQHQAATIPVQPEELQDVDTPEDLARLR